MLTLLIKLHYQFILNFEYKCFLITLCNFLLTLKMIQMFTSEEVYFHKQNPNVPQTFYYYSMSNGFSRIKYK